MLRLSEEEILSNSTIMLEDNKAGLASLIILRAKCWTALKEAKESRIYV